MTDRLSRIRDLIEDYDAEALLVSSLPNIRWAVGFTGTNGLLLVDKERALFVTDGRYTEQARQEVEGAEVLISSNGLMERLLDTGALDEIRRVIIQADDVSLAKYQQLKERCSRKEWIPETSVLSPLVGAKEEHEHKRIRRAQSLTEDVFRSVIDDVDPGDTEREIAAEVTYRHLQGGADKMAFDPIVASGPNAARPHARPTDRPLQKGDLVVFDMGGVLDGYASDMTRTVAVGDPSDVALTGYEAVLEAQRRALEQAHSGMTGKELDAVARDYLEDKGFGDDFTHGLGHGIGLEVHEWPRVSYSAEEELPTGACVTIEPGIYVPEEGYGIRIEDIIVLHPDGHTNLTDMEKELAVIA
jgi:Xaa-Pro aminopeptidase